MAMGACPRWLGGATWHKLAAAGSTTPRRVSDSSGGGLGDTGRSSPVQGRAWYRPGVWGGDGAAGNSLLRLGRKE